MAVRIEDGLVEAREVNELIGEANRRKKKLLLREQKEVIELGTNAVGQTGFHRGDVIPSVQKTITRTLGLASSVGFERVPTPHNLSDRDRSRFNVKSKAVLTHQGAIALRLVFSGHGPLTGAEDFWKLLEEEGTEAAVAHFCGVGTPRVLASTSSDESTIASVALAPSEFNPQTEDINLRFRRACFPFSGIRALSSPYEQARPRETTYPDASHFSNEQLIWAAGLDIRFGRYLDAFSDALSES